MDVFLSIVFDVLAPVLILVAIGALLRWRMHIDAQSLSRLNLYVLTPAFIFDRVSSSQLPWSDMGGIVATTVIQVALLGLVVLIIGRSAGISRRTLAAIALGVMFYNSGNVGLPLAELAFPATDSRASGAVPQAFVVLTQNVLCFTVGMGIGTSATSGTLWQMTRRILTIPVLYTLVAALGTRYWLGLSPENHLPTIVAAPMKFLAGGLIPVALLLLGVQLASRPRWPRWKPVSLVLVLRLLFAPALMAALLYTLHRTLPGSFLDLWPWPAQLIIFTAAVPTAVNTLILTMELDGDADLQADCVFWTTLLSAITLGLWLAIVRAVFV